MIHIGGDLRVSFHYLMQKVARNGTVPLTIVRAGKVLNVQMPVPTTAQADPRPGGGVSPLFHLWTAGVLQGYRVQFIAVTSPG